VIVKEKDGVLHTIGDLISLQSGNIVFGISDTDPDDIPRSAYPELYVAIAAVCNGDDVNGCCYRTSVTVLITTGDIAVDTVSRPVEFNRQSFLNRKGGVLFIDMDDAKSLMVKSCANAPEERQRLRQRQEPERSCETSASTQTLMKSLP